MLIMSIDHRFQVGDRIRVKRNLIMATAVNNEAVGIIAEGDEGTVLRIRHDYEAHETILDTDIFVSDRFRALSWEIPADAADPVVPPYDPL